MTTTNTLVRLRDVPVLDLAPTGSAIRGEADALDVMGDAYGHEATVVAIPVERLAREFFDLSTGVLGAVAQKFANYRIRVAIVGDVSEHVAKSKALRDFVYETNQGRQLWFVASLEELGERLGP